MRNGGVDIGREPRGGMRRRTDDDLRGRPKATVRLDGDALEPRKIPRQARSRDTFNAIVDACSQVLAAGSYDALTTNSISERAGVSIGTLYEYFPNREAIVASLVANACDRLVNRMEAAIGEAARLPAFPGTRHLLAVGVATLGARENGFRVLLRDAPFVAQLPAFRSARETLTDLCQKIRVGSEARLNLPKPELDTWLISQMLFAAMLEIAFQDDGDEARELRLGELAHLTFRMFYGRDPNHEDRTVPVAF